MAGLAIGRIMLKEKKGFVFEPEKEGFKDGQDITP